MVFILMSHNDTKLLNIFIDYKIHFNLPFYDLITVTDH